MQHPKRRRQTWSAGMAAVLVIGATLATAGRLQAVVICVPNISIDSSCTSGSATIGAAIGAASAGDTVLVGSGLYNESPVIDKTLTLRALVLATEANVGNSAAQAIINGNGAENTLTVLSGVNGVVIDGFEITNPTHSPSIVTSPAGILVQTDNSGGQTISIDIMNNVIHTVADPARAAVAQTFGEAGILAFNIGNGSTISGNTIFDIRDSAPPTSTGESPGSGRAQGILVKSSNGAASGVTIDANTLHAIQDVAIRFNGGTTSADVTYNTIDTVGSAGTGFLSGIGIDHIGYGAVSGNTISNVTGGFGLGIQASGTTTIADNRISAVFGGNSSLFPGAAILINTSNVSVMDNSVTNNAIGILTVAAGTTATTNCIQGNPAGGLINAGSSVVDAENNWWGATNGPGGIGMGFGDTVIGNVDFDPWSIVPTSCAPDVEIICNCSASGAITGGPGPNLLFGTPGDDIICGFGGRDLIFGRGGADCIDGGAGKDTLFGGRGNDQLLGGGGRDKIFGNGDHDLMLGGSGRDRLFGGRGHDTLDGGIGFDIILGGPGLDECQHGEVVIGCEL